MCDKNSLKLMNAKLHLHSSLEFCFYFCQLCSAQMPTELTYSASISSLFCCSLIIKIITKLKTLRGDQEKTRTRSLRCA